MDWFEQLFGFAEPKDRSELYQRLYVQGEFLHDRSTARSWRCGRLEVPTLAQLRTRNPKPTGGELRLREIVADVQELHLAHPNTVFQAASQFNLLEMVSPEVTPDAGIGLYSYDHTQGPACAIACGAGTVFRNYFAPVDDHIGQTAERQINTLSYLEAALHNDQHHYWTVKNGYQHATTEALERLRQELDDRSDAALKELAAELRVGIQWNTQVTLDQQAHIVTQVYCSGVPIGYNDAPTQAWLPFAQLILNATYEATFWTAWEQFQHTGKPQLFLTLVGGGVFKNPTPWIIESIGRSLKIFAQAPLEVAIVSYGASQPAVQALVQWWNAS